MSVTSDLLTGLAVKLAAAGLGITWSPSGVYTAGQTGAWMKILPAAPDRAVVLNAVVQGDDISIPLSRVMVQVRGRGLPNKPLDVDDLMDSISDVLHGSTNLTFGTVHVTQMNRLISIPNGMDDMKRWERIDQYYLDVDVPPTANRPAGGSW
jgi:hypothetical protein